MGIITILVGVGLLFISLFFSSGSNPRRDFLGNISVMEIVLDEGRYVSGTGPYLNKGRVAIPLKYPLTLSVVLILLGTGVVLISKNKKTNA